MKINLWNCTMSLATNGPKLQNIFQIRIYKSHVAMASSSKTNFTQDFAGPSVILMLSYNRTFLKPKISFLLISFLR